ncbi:hypothetical protein SELMODRAFT_94322 [Selaginella moellendorffii]|uniref:Uncharacterized protein n=1 Tax=Selaginella moellendorffii TaxID=88036 RepID=D8RID7_SELML|nr:hypothetical protein SELMODRAFT_94322 [Selaginella moellendorffii]
MAAAAAAAAAAVEEKKFSSDEFVEPDDLVSNNATDVWNRPSRKSTSGNWKACWLIFGCEVCERVAYYAISSNLANYLFQQLHENRADAATNVNNWSGTLFLTPLLGAFLGDAFLGRYLTLSIFLCIYLMALVLVTMSVSVPGIKAEQNQPVSSIQSGFFYFALYLMALGAGGIKPNVTSFAGDQFDEEDPQESKRKMSFLNWWFVSISSGNLFSVSVLVYIQVTYGWTWGWGGAAAVVALATLLFFSGRSNYRTQKPAGSPFTRVAQVLVAATRKWNVSVPDDDEKLYELSDKEAQFPHIRKLPRSKEFTRFLEKAAVVSEKDLQSKEVKPWSLCPVTQVEEVKLLVRVMPIWFTNLIFSSVFAQVGTFFLNQGDTMERHLGRFQIPAASFPLFITLTICIILPLYDRYFVPFARRITGNERGITMLQRIGIGQVISTVSIAIAALVEMKRLRVARQHGLLDRPQTTVPMSAFWLLPQYALTGVCEVFISVGQNEFFYDQAPDSMRSIGAALYLSTISIGSFISSLLVEMVVKFTSTKGGGVDSNWINDNLNRAHIDYFYWLLTLLSIINLGIYVLCARWYTYKNVGDIGIGSSIGPDITGTTTMALARQSSLESQ